MASVDVQTTTDVRPQDRVEAGSVNIPVGKFPDTQTGVTPAVDDISDNIVKKFNQALTEHNHKAISLLFLENGYWRDHLALSWDLRTLKGREKIVEYLDSSHPRISVEIDRSSAFRRPQIAALDGIGEPQGIQFFINFVTHTGSGRGVFRLVNGKDDRWQILSLFTGLDSIETVIEPLGPNRSNGRCHGTTADAKYWQDYRKEQVNFAGSDPAVLIVGASQGGLSLAARLKMLNIEALIVDRESQVGDNWRQRYPQLILHDPVWFNHMPYFHFPAHWPVFTPKDKMAEFLEMYAKILELNVWTKSYVAESVWDEQRQRWNVTLNTYEGPGGKFQSRTFHPRHIVQATGQSGKMNFPPVKGLNDFQGDRICHSSQFPGANSEGGNHQKKAVVVGSCNSAHDIAQDFCLKGYEVTMIQRSSTCVISSDAVVKIGLGGLYSENGPPVEDADLWLWSLPSELLKAQQVKVTALQNQHDAETLAGLEKAGFKVDKGPNDAGLLMKYFQRGGGYYIDVGASQLIVDGKIKIKQGVEIEEVLSDGLRLSDDSVLNADEIIFATGYQNMRSQTRMMFGDDVANRTWDVWGYDEEGEMRSIWRNSGHPGLWYMGGNLALNRYYSRVLSLQIKARELGLSK